jgi:hypothetical protein
MFHRESPVWEQIQEAWERFWAAVVAYCNNLLK